jgi:putative oxidoreductase
MTLLQSVATALHRWDWVGPLVARVSVGLLFVISGRAKLFVPARRDQMRETIRQAGLPMPQMSALLISAIELVFGALLLVGLLTPLACVLLIAVMVGALATEQLRRIEARSVVDWLGAFLYLPEVLYVVILTWLLLSGPGRLSIDMAVSAPRS